MNILLSRKARFVMGRFAVGCRLADGRRCLSVSSNQFGNNRVMAKQKRTIDCTKPVTYTEVNESTISYSLYVYIMKIQNDDIMIT